MLINPRRRGDPSPNWMTTYRQQVAALLNRRPSDQELSRAISMYGVGYSAKQAAEKTAVYRSNPMDAATRKHFVAWGRHFLPGNKIVPMLGRVTAFVKRHPEALAWGWPKVVEAIMKRKPELQEYAARLSQGAGRDPYLPMKRGNPRRHLRVRMAQGGYRIDEIVTPQGHYITWPEFYATKESARKAAEKTSRVPRKKNIAVRDPSKRGKKSGIITHKPISGSMIATGTYDTGINLLPFMFVEATGRKGGLMLIAYGAYNAYGLIGPEKGGVALVNEVRHDVVGTLDIPYDPARRLQVLQDIYASKNWVESADRWGFGMRYKPNPGAKWHREHAAEARQMARDTKHPGNRHYYRGREDANLEAYGASLHRPGKVANPLAVTYSDPQGEHNIVFRDRRDFERWQEQFLKPVKPFQGSPRSFGLQRRFKTKQIKVKNPLAVTYTDVGGKPHNIIFRDRRSFERWQDRNLVDTTFSELKGGDVSGFALQRRFKTKQIKSNPVRPWESQTLGGKRNMNPSAKRQAERAERLASRVTSPSLRKKLTRQVDSYKAFHFDTPDRAYKVQVPSSFPKKLWMLGKLHKVYGIDGRLMLSGGLLTCGKFGRSPLFILNAKSHGAPARFRARQTEYVPQRASRLHGSVYYHEHSRRSPVTVTRIAPSYYKVDGSGLRVTRRGIVG
jgi:hypothetical protein